MAAGARIDARPLPHRPGVGAGAAASIDLTGEHEAAAGQHHLGAGQPGGDVLDERGHRGGIEGEDRGLLAQAGALLAGGAGDAEGERGQARAARRAGGQDPGDRGIGEGEAPLEEGQARRGLGGGGQRLGEVGEAGAAKAELGGELAEGLGDVGARRGVQEVAPVGGELERARRQRADGGLDQLAGADAEAEILALEDEAGAGHAEDATDLHGGEEVAGDGEAGERPGQLEAAAQAGVEVERDAPLLGERAVGQDALIRDVALVLRIDPGEQLDAAGERGRAGGRGRARRRGCRRRRRRAGAGGWRGAPGRGIREGGGGPRAQREAGDQRGAGHQRGRDREGGQIQSEAGHARRAIWHCRSRRGNEELLSARWAFRLQCELAITTWQIWQLESH